MASTPVRPPLPYLEMLEVLRHAATQRVVWVHVGAVDLEREREVAECTRSADGRVRAHDGRLEQIRAMSRSQQGRVWAEGGEIGLDACMRVQHRPSRVW